jgi:hypothetical protein
MTQNQELLADGGTAAALVVHRSRAWLEQGRVALSRETETEIDVLVIAGEIAIIEPVYRLPQMPPDEQGAR